MKSSYSNMLKKNLNNLVCEGKRELVKVPSFCAFAIKKS